MVKDDSIFSLRFGSNAKLQPSDEELKLFLESRKDGGKELQRDDLAPYWDLLTRVADFKTNGGKTFSDKILYTVLAHSHFAKPALKSAVEQFKYHLDVLAKIDFKKPHVFIKSAEQEMARLNPKKKDEALRLERMRDMVEERKRVIEGLKKRWIEVTEELTHIVSYVADNLAKIEKLCEHAIEILVNDQIERKKELELIESIKSEFKERLRESLHLGTITKEDLENAKEEVGHLSKRTADMLRNDVFAVTRLYEMIYEHAGKILRELRKSLDEISQKKHASYEEDVRLYQSTEKKLVDLVAACRFEVKTAEIDTDGERDLLAEKRSEIFDHLVGLLGA